MIDYRKLTAYTVARQFAVEIYRATLEWPKTEQFGLTSQIRRAAVSVASNLVEGASRESSREWARYVEISLGSAREAHFQLELAKDLGFIVPDSLSSLADESCRVLHGLYRSVRSTLYPLTSNL